MADPDIIRNFAQGIEKRYEEILLKTKVSAIFSFSKELRANFDAADGSPATPASDTFDWLLLSAGRRSNGKSIGAEKAGVIVNAREPIAETLFALE